MSMQELNNALGEYKKLALFKHLITSNMFISSMNAKIDIGSLNIPLLVAAYIFIQSKIQDDPTEDGAELYEKGFIRINFLSDEGKGELENMKRLIRKARILIERKSRSEKKPFLFKSIRDADELMKISLYRYIRFLIAGMGLQIIPSLDLDDISEDEDISEGSETVSEEDDLSEEELDIQEIDASRYID